jgi:hypothetical protein
MPPLYKEGLCWLVLLAVTTACYFALCPLLGAQAATGAFGLLGVGGFFPLLYRKRRQAIALDERDRQIASRAQLAGYSVFWPIFVLGTMAIWEIARYNGQSTISIEVLPGIVFGGFLVFITARALAIVIQYHRQNAAKED